MPSLKSSSRAQVPAPTLMRPILIDRNKRNTYLSCIFFGPFLYDAYFMASMYEIVSARETAQTSTDDKERER